MEKADHLVLHRVAGHEIVLPQRSVVGGFQAAALGYLGAAVGNEVAVEQRLIEHGKKFFRHRPFRLTDGIVGHAAKAVQTELGQTHGIFLRLMETLVPDADIVVELPVELTRCGGGVSAEQEFLRLGNGIGKKVLRQRATGTFGKEQVAHADGRMRGAVLPYGLPQGGPLPTVGESHVVIDFFFLLHCLAEQGGLAPRISGSGRIEISESQCHGEAQWHEARQTAESQHEGDQQHRRTHGQCHQESTHHAPSKELQKIIGHPAVCLHHAERVGI